VYFEEISQSFLYFNKTSKLHYLYTDDILSEWPGGPYALLTPNEGCPESDAHGWRRGYLLFAWKNEQVFESANGCSMKSFLQNTEVEHVTHNDLPCKHDLTASYWPFHKSNLLGPFSRYALRLNFCCKEKNAIDSPYHWPPGSYRIFGDISGCPKGTHHSYQMLNLQWIIIYNTKPHFD
jgi:hypothetical protein